MPEDFSLTKDNIRKAYSLQFERIGFSGAMFYFGARGTFLLSRYRGQKLLSFHPSCPHKEQCHAKIFKKVARVLVTKKSLTRISLEEKMSGKEYDLYRRIRNGVETIPSILRRKYHLEKLPLGKQRGKFFFGSKIAALNFRKLFCFARGLGSYAPNPLLG